MDKSQKKKNRIAYLEKLRKDNPNLPDLDVMIDIADSLEELVKKEQDKLPNPLPVKIEGAEIVTIKGEQGDKGDTGDKGDKGEQGDKGDKGDPSKIPGEKGEKGEKGERGDDGKDGENGKNGENGKDGSPDTAEQIVAKINSLPTDEDAPKIHVSHIDGIEEINKRIETVKKSIPPQSPFGFSGRDIFKDIDISAQFNGVTKTFNIQAVYYIVSVSLSSYPYGALRKNIDYTWTPTSITFTDEVDASTQLSSGQKCIIQAVLG